jgi:hypothetical protein
MGNSYNQGRAKMKKIILGIVLLVPLIARAHPVSISWANARISDGKIAITFTIFAEDLILFHHVEPDDLYNYESNTLRSLAKDHAFLIEKYFFIDNENANRLPNRVISVNTNSLDIEQINVMDLMKYKIHYQLVFDLEPVQWEKLVFHQEFKSAKSGIPAITFLSVFKDGVQLVDKSEVSPGSPFVLYREHNESERNPSELTSSYFTITPRGIRHELTIPGDVFRTMSYKPLSEESPYDNSSAYFEKNNPVVINNEKVTPELLLIQTFDSESGDVKYPEGGFVYLDLFYPFKDPINSATIHWLDFSWKFRWFNSKIYSLNGVHHHTFSRFQPEFFWKLKLKTNVKEQ